MSYTSGQHGGAVVPDDPKKTTGWWYVLRSLTTEDAGDSIPDLVKIQWLAGSVIAVFGLAAMIVFTGISVVTGKGYDPVGFGGGFAALLGGFSAYMMGSGAALFAKNKSGA